MFLDMIFARGKGDLRGTGHNEWTVSGQTDRFDWLRGKRDTVNLTTGRRFKMFVVESVMSLRLISLTKAYKQLFSSLAPGGTTKMTENECVAAQGHYVSVFIM